MHLRLSNFWSNCLSQKPWRPCPLRQPQSQQVSMGRGVSYLAARAVTPAKKARWSKLYRYWSFFVHLCTGLSLPLWSNFACWDWLAPRQNEPCAGGKKRPR